MKELKDRQILYWNYGILNDVKLEKARKSGVLLNNKKKLSSTLKMANVAKSKQDTFGKLKDVVGRDLKRLEAYYDYLMPKQILNFNYSLQKASDLEKLTLMFRGGIEFTDNRLILLGHGLKSLHSLKTLSIEMVEPTRINDKGFCKFAADLSNLTHLESLDFSVDLCHVSDVAVARLAKSIGHLSELRNIDLELIRFGNLRDKALPKLAKYLLKLKKLESLTLDISWSRQITEEGILELTDSIAKIKTLRSFSLTCRKCQVTDRTISSLSTTLANLPDLTSVNLDMYGCTQISEESLCELFKNFSSLVNARKISLYLGPGSQHPTSFGDQGMKMLGEGIKSLANLKEFKSTFCEFNNLKDQGLGELGKAMSEMKALEKVELRFSSCKELTREGLDNLGQLISKNPNVEHIYLNQ